MEALASRLDGVLQRLDALQLRAGLGPADLLAQRQALILQRLAALETAAGLAPLAADGGEHSAGPVQRRLAAELVSLGLAPGRFRFVRAPADYYARPLEFRRGVLGAASVAHLCKSVVMTNTRAHASVDGISNPLNAKHYLVLVQYTARLSSEKLNALVHRLSAGAVAKKYYNLRLASEEDNDRLTGFGHNAVSPVGLAVRLPVVLSHRIAELRPDFFWMGGGEEDLKLGMSAADFMSVYQPVVGDITCGGDAGDEEGA